MADKPNKQAATKLEEVVVEEVSEEADTTKTNPKPEAGTAEQEPAEPEVPEGKILDKETGELRDLTKDEIKEIERKKRIPKEEIDTVRARLYDRSLSPQETKRTQLQPTDLEDVPRAWGQPDAPDAPADTSTGVRPVGRYNRVTGPRMRNYRSTIVIFGVLFFIVTLMVSSLYLFFGDNTISANNISVSITGPGSLNGGETLDLVVGVTNENPTAIKAASLIVQYPVGTLSPEEGQRELQREVIPLEQIAAGETLNIQLAAILFGEEDERKQIKAEVEYQVEGSNGIFFKEADPHDVTINSSPVSLRIESLSQVSSGQMVDVNMIVRSNSNTVLNDLLVQATYPFGFEYEFAKPDPVSGQNTWRIEELQPGETVTITTRGRLTGLPSDERIYEASVGVSGSQSSYDISSIFSRDAFSYNFEKEFIDLKILVNGNDVETLTVDRDDEVRADITFRNPLEETIYDAELNVKLSGSALNEEGVEVPDGFYDSIKNTIIFDRNTKRGLQQIQPGEIVLLAFTLTPEAFVKRDPDIEMEFASKATRILDNSVPESVIGSKSRIVRFESQINMLASIEPLSGPIPPVAEKLTQYKVSLRVESGTNDLENAEVKATLPTYVTWFDIYSGDGDMSFLSNSRTVTWTIGDLPANSATMASFNIGFLPSISQVGRSPNLMGIQNFSATDRFTSTVIRQTSPAVNTLLSKEQGYEQNDGVIRRTEND